MVLEQVKQTQLCWNQIVLNIFEYGFTETINFQHSIDVIFA